jgi:hypothetical protein
MIKPTVGRVVWFYPHAGDSTLCQAPGEPLAAIIARVWSDRVVNLSVIDANGKQEPRTSVTLVQDGDEKPQGYYCEWMPYQKGQAAKTESLEQIVERNSANLSGDASAAA